ncbi:glucose PTS transporter subunit IIA [Lactococcus garvieae]|uniref:PTS transporter subunit IIABC n=1 Tax=Lactococcus garvieae TaxID=1363 RepID=UPI002FD824B4
MFKKFSQLGRAFMLPIAILPAAGLLLGLGGSLTNEAAINAYPFLNVEWLQTILKVMSFAGNAVFANIALIFAIGLAVGLANGDKGTAGLSAGVSFLVYTATISGLLQLFSPDTVVDTGVVGSIVIGGMVAYLHNKYRMIELPQFLGFFGGSRFIPIITSFSAIFIGAFFYLIWPPIQGGLTSVGTVIAGMGSFGTFLYGFLLRLTGAVGLHHTIYPMFWYTALGGSEMVAGHTVVGAQNIFFAQLADPNHTGLFTYGTRFFAGRFATMMFGLPAAALAMYHSIPKVNRKKDGALYLSGGLTSFLTGITEPLEYTFLFVAPWLYVVHAFLDGLSFFFADIMNIRIGNSFSGGLIDYLLFGVLQGKDKTNWPSVLLLGIIWAIIYYIVFRFCIKKFNVQIPGMIIEEESNEISESDNMKKTGNKLYDESVQIIQALGTLENVESVEACATRLRVAVKDSSVVKKDVFKKLGAPAVIEVSGGIQAIFGGKADIYSQQINQIIETGGVLEEVQEIPSDIVMSSESENISESHLEVLTAVVSGKLIDLSDVNDPVFSSKALGEGYGIVPESNDIYSPVYGEITSIFKTKHALGILTDNGLEILIHMGLDTVELKGEPFEILVEEGQDITPNTKVARANISEIKESGKDPVILVVITNTLNKVKEFSLDLDTSNDSKVLNKQVVGHILTNQ